MKSAAARIGRGLIWFAIAVGLSVGFRVPQGVADLNAKQQAIRQLQRENADLAREVQERRERVRKLRDSRSEQELEIRKRLKLQRQGETAIVVPGQNR
jgi:cell division protein FtsB